MARKRSGGPRSTPTRGRGLTVRPGGSAKRRASSRRWLERQLNDPYVAEARERGLRSRAAFKLLQLDDRFRFLRPGQRVLDLGAAPGGWTQVAVGRVRPAATGGAVIAVDRAPMQTVAGATVLELDLQDAEAPCRLRAALDGPADVVLSDMAPSSTGHAATDHLRVAALAEAAHAVAAAVLGPGGAFVCKLFQGGAEKPLLDRLKRDFARVRHAKPAASRAESSEVYLVATGFRGARQPPDDGTSDSLDG